MKFELTIPTKIHFGTGCLRDALVAENSVLCGNIFVVSSGSAKKSGLLEQVCGYIKELPNVRSVASFSSITSNPKVEEVNAGIEAALSNDTNVIVGLGGGSALDAAKAIAAGTGAKEHIDRYFFEGISPGERTLPIIAIPTTAGTGSELSKSGILTSRARSVKGGVRGGALYPRVAIVDPSLTYSVPKEGTMETGFDVLAHAVESYISRASNSFTHALSEQAILYTAKYLPMLANDLNDMEAREGMSYASMIMGINLGNASTALPHRLQYPVGALTDTGHGKGLIALYPAWIQLTYRYSPKLFNRIGELLSGHVCTDYEDVQDAFLKFMDATCGRVKLSEMGLKPADADRMAEMVSGNLAMDPAGTTPEIVRAIYQEALKDIV